MDAGKNIALANFVARDNLIGGREQLIVLDTNPLRASIENDRIIKIMNYCMGGCMGDGLHGGLMHGLGSGIAWGVAWGVDCMGGD